MDKQNRLFKSFQQVDASTTRHYGGTGLGLAICKRLAELMGGKIWVESDAGKGANFHFTVLATAAAATAPPTWQSAQPQLAGKRLLAVEDNATNRRVLEGMLRHWGSRPTTVDSGPAALAELRRAAAAGEPYPLLLVDAMMPLACKVASGGMSYAPSPNPSCMIAPLMTAHGCTAAYIPSFFIRSSCAALI